MEDSKIFTALTPVFLVSRVSGVFPLNNKFQLSPIWSLFPASLFVLLLANAYFFSIAIEGFSGFSLTMYISLCFFLTLATLLVIIFSYTLGPSYSKCVRGFTQVEKFFDQFGIQVRYRSRWVLADIALRAIVLFLVCIITYRTHRDVVLQLYLTVIGFYVTQWAISCVELHIVAIAVYLTDLYKSLSSALPSPDIDYYLEASSLLAEIAEDFQSLFTKAAFISSAVLFVCTTLDLYFLIIVYVDNMDNEAFLSFIYIRSLSRAYQLWRLVSSIGYLQQQAERLDVRFYTTALEDPTDEIAKKEKLLLYFAMKQKISFSACGFFPVDFTLIHSIVAAVTNYLVILVQFGNKK